MFEGNLVQEFAYSIKCSLQLQMSPILKRVSGYGLVLHLRYQHRQNWETRN